MIMHAISFIIPVLNGETFIGDCLDYMLREMTDRDEIIIVDNGSTDASLDIARRYDRVSILAHPDITIGALRNRGAAVARGDVLAFIDCDCLIWSGWRQAVEEVLADETVHATGSHFDLSLEPTWIERAWIPPRRTSPVKTHYMPSGNLVVRKSVYDAIGGFDEQLVTDEDTEIGHRLNQNGYCIIDAPGVRVKHQGNAKTLGQFTGKEKWHATSITTSMSAQAFDKPMVMTFVFMLSVLAVLVSLPLSFFFPVNPWWSVGAVLIAPILTALYRAHTFGVYRYIPHLVLLFFIFYAVRSMVILESLFTRK